MVANFSPACMNVFAKASKKMGGVPVMYATEYARPDNRLEGTSNGAIARYAFDNMLKAGSKALGSGLPTDGWIVVTDDGMGVFSRRMGGIGTHKGTIPFDLIATISVQHEKKPGKATIEFVFADMSEVIIRTKTKATYEALSPWIQQRSNAATSPLAAPGANAPDSLGAPGFDMNALYESNPSLHH